MTPSRPFRLGISQCIAKGTEGSGSGRSSETSDSCSSLRTPFPSWVVGAATAAVSLSVLQLAVAAESHAASVKNTAVLKKSAARSTPSNASTVTSAAGDLTSAAPAAEASMAVVDSQASVAPTSEGVAATVTSGSKKSKAARKSRSGGDASTSGSGSGSGSGSRASGKPKVQEMEADERAAWASGLPVVVDSVPYSQVVELKQRGELKHIIKHPKATLGVRGEGGKNS